jgi:hypothetical protein
MSTLIANLLITPLCGLLFIYVVHRCLDSQPLDHE